MHDLKNKIIYIGGLCHGHTVEEMLECSYNRSLTVLGSTNFYNKTLNMTGILSNNKTINPGFYNWNIGFVIYWFFIFLIIFLIINNILFIY